MNPEKNPKLRAYLYTIGLGGTIHLLTLFFIGIKERDISYFNPIFAVDGDKLLSELAATPLFFIGGWLIMATLVAIIYRVINRQ